MPSRGGGLGVNANAVRRVSIVGEAEEDSEDTPTVAPAAAAIAGIAEGEIAVRDDWGAEEPSEASQPSEISTRTPAFPEPERQGANGTQDNPEEDAKEAEREEDEDGDADGAM